MECCAVCMYDDDHVIDESFCPSFSLFAAYAYLDGELHVKVSLAMDAIIRDLTTKRKATPAYLCTPTDVHVISKEAHDAAEAQYNALSLVNIIAKLSIFNIPGSGYLVGR